MKVSRRKLFGIFGGAVVASKVTEPEAAVAAEAPSLPPLPAPFKGYNLSSGAITWVDVEDDQALVTRGMNGLIPYR